MVVDDLSRLPTSQTNNFNINEDIQIYSVAHIHVVASHNAEDEVEPLKMQTSLAAQK